MSTAVALAWLLTAVFALLDWAAVARGLVTLERWAKPAVMAGLIAVVLLSGGGAGAVRLWMLAALTLGMLGDVLLLGDGDRRFLGGLAAFLVGHLAWVGAFLVAGVSPTPLSVVGVLVVLVSLVVGRGILAGAADSGGIAMAVPVGCYMAVIGVMAVLGWSGGSLLVALGASLFVVSDTVLGLGRFDRSRPWMPLTVIVSYHLAQALLVAGLLGA